MDVVAKEFVVGTVSVVNIVTSLPLLVDVWSATLVVKDGFPVVDVLSPLGSTLG